MNKKVLFAATMAAMLASCSSSDDLSLQTVNSQPSTVGYNPYDFSAYTQRGLTRSGDAGVLDNTQLSTKGFGVFGYYTNMNMYEPTASPNFMYNEHVTKVGGSWTYSPIKYWPNEYGSKAQSDDVDQVTFFAYAPYVENTPATGKVADDKVGITGFTRNTAAGDPYVKYVGSLDPTKCVDLCWGVVDPSADQTWDIINGGSQTMAKGMPWMNVQRPQKSLGQKMKFVFKHALSQLNVQIDADVNTNEHGQGAELDANTKVFVRSITFNGFAMKGALNLNNEDAGVPNWKGYNCSNEPLLSEEYTVYDGMKDGKEGTGYTASNEKVTGLNATIIQDKKWGEAAEGVTKTAKNLFNSATATAPVYVIPTGDDMNVTIVYDIETKDEKLAGTVSDLETAGVSTETKLTKTITVSGGTDALKLEAGKKYTINLHLGLSQVEFEAAVSDWEDAAEGEAWVPENGQGLVDNGVALADAQVGYFVGVNGKAYATQDDVDAAGIQAVAWIAYIKQDPSDPTDQSLAFALTDDGPSGTSWNAFAANPGWGSTPSRAAIDGGTWRWPIKTDFDKMLAGFQALQTTGNGVTPDGISIYWSSTEEDADYAWLLYFDGLDSSVDEVGKGSVISNDYVRAVLAF